MSYSLNASNGSVSFTPSPSGKTVMVTRRVDSDIEPGHVHEISKRMSASRARNLYRGLVAKGYVVA